MIITRDIINKNIVYTDWYQEKKSQIRFKTYTYKELCDSINYFKNLLLYQYSARKKQTVLIGISNSNKLQIAAVFACSELGMPFVIVDYTRPDEFIDPDYVDPKTKILSPINFFIVSKDYNTIGNKFKMFTKHCNHTIIVDDSTDFSQAEENTVINADTDDIFMKCTSSGTTGTPKLVTHTHNFIYHLIKRNSNFFDGSIGLIWNLNHGSSLATFFLPSLVSSKTIACHNLNFEIIKTLVFFPEKIDITLHHLMVPYSHYIDVILSNIPNKFLQPMTLYTLSTIKKEWVEHVKNNYIKEILSIFGSNETSGPTLINKASDEMFEESVYFKVDDFYDINLSDSNEFLVTLPAYNKTINTNDRFEVIGNRYKHIGRSDLIRINGMEINQKLYDKNAKQILGKCDLIYDTIKDSMYLALWEDVENADRKIEVLKNNISYYSNKTHTINKHAFLQQEKFLVGIKLDQELLRDYFRNYV